MPIPSTDQLPAALRAVNARALFVLRLTVSKPFVVGTTPGGSLRRVGVIMGGSFSGDRLQGDVLEGGSDWQTVRPDGVITIDVRLVLKTKDDSIITMRYPGVRHGPADVLAKIDSGQGDAIDPASYYLRIAPTFETATAKYDWLNRILAVGVGQRLAGEVIYSVFELL